MERLPRYAFPIADYEMVYLKRDFFARDTVTVAQDLIGTTVIVGNCAGKIVETEAYRTDAASHAAKLTERSRLMYETYGCCYVYFTYGLHYCFNITTERAGVGAVLIRAVEPLRGIAEMMARRSVEDVKKLASGPARFAQAFGIDKQLNGKPIGRDVKIRQRKETPPISASSRIGISRATDLEWRFYETGNPFVSRFKAR